MGSIEVVSVSDREDGGCDVQIEMDAEAQRLLIEEGFIALLRKYHEVEGKYE